MNDKFEKWRADNQSSLFTADKMDCQKAFLAGSGLKEKRFGCQIAAGKFTHHKCVFDDGERGMNRCGEADAIIEHGGSKTDCIHWRVIEG